MANNQYTVSSVPTPDLTKELVILNTVLQGFNITILEEEVLEPSRAIYYVNIRYIVCYYLRHRGYTLQGIARTLKKDHTTVLHALNKVRFKNKEELQKCEAMQFHIKCVEKIQLITVVKETTFSQIDVLTKTKIPC